MNLWGIAVTSQSAVTVEVPLDRDLLITRAALASTTIGSNVLQYTTEGQKPVVLGTLRYEGVEQFELDLCVSASSTLKFSLKGKGEVHLSGYFNALCMVDSDSESDYGSYDDEEDAFPDLDSSSDDGDFLSVTKSPSESISSDGDEDVPIIEEIVVPEPRQKRERKETVVPKKQQEPKQTPPKKETGTKRGASSPSPLERPSKKAKTEASLDKHHCTACKRDFSSEQGYQQHMKAKHGQ